MTGAVTGGAKEVPTVLRPVFATVRTITLLAYRLAVLTRGWPRAIATLSIGMIVIGVLLVTTSFALLGISGALLIAVGIYLLVLVTYDNLKHPLRWLLLGLIVIVGVVAVALTLRSVRSHVFDESKTGFVREHVLPWLHDSDLAAAVIFVSVIVFVALFVTLLFKRKSS